jgi:hypothetical protein
MTAALIVVEREGHWATALRRGLADFARAPSDDGRGEQNLPVPVTPRIIETRSLDECWDELRRRPAALVAIELTEPLLPSILAALRRLDREHPQAAAIVLMERRLTACIPLLREAGAVHCIASPRRLSEAVELLRRHAARHPAAADSPEQMLAELPWSN